MGREPRLRLRVGLDVGQEETVTRENERETRAEPVHEDDLEGSHDSLLVRGRHDHALDRSTAHTGYQDVDRSIISVEAGAQDSHHGSERVGMLSGTDKEEPASTASGPRHARANVDALGTGVEVTGGEEDPDAGVEGAGGAEGAAVVYLPGNSSADGGGVGEWVVADWLREKRERAGQAGVAVVGETGLAVGMEGGGEADVEGAFYAYDPAAFAAYYGQRPFEVLWRALQVPCCSEMLGVG